MTDRRFTEAEVASIFERATESAPRAQRQLGSGEGMTLAELQSIGREVGIAPDAIARAALTLGQGAQPVARTLLGIPIGVGRTVELGRRLTDDEWERIVVDLRETFDARGTVKQDGSLRQWTNGNLQALLEPTPTGHRIRLRTVKREASTLMLTGLGLFGAGATLITAAVLRGAVGDIGMLSSLSFLATSGAVMFGFNALRLPAWARLRQQQMDGVAERVAVIAASPPADEPPAAK